jgi:hypothetical protein
MRTYPLAQRKSKVRVEGFARPHVVGDSLGRFLKKLPRFLAARDLLEVAAAVVTARGKGRTVLLGMGAHVIKVGLSPVVIDLLREGWLSAVATNGAGMVHDFEVALAGHTSEDVDATLGLGEFGMAEETGGLLNEMIVAGVARGQGLGDAVGRALGDRAAPFADRSLLVTSARLDRPATIHVAMGTDIHHLHPAADGASIGEGSHRDFLAFCRRVAGLEDGVYINLGSAVVLPEVFLKAVSLSRNLGYSLRRITTVNMDFVQHYRPTTNVVRRPAALGGKGYALTGHHEILLPLLAGAIKEEGAARGVTPAPSSCFA